MFKKLFSNKKKKKIMIKDKSGKVYQLIMVSKSGIRIVLGPQ